MKNGIRASIRQFIQRNVIPGDSPPQRSSLDEQDMSRQQRNPNVLVSGLPVAQVPPLRGRHTAFPHLQSSGRLRGRHAARVHRAGDPPSVNEQV
jgi:hypothetical protein